MILLKNVIWIFNMPDRPIPGITSSRGVTFGVPCLAFADVVVPT